MFQLFPPQSTEIPNSGSTTIADPLAAVSAEARPNPTDRPWLLTNMIASADGATHMAGLSGPLGSPADTEMLVAYRTVADAILVGAATAHSEGYGVPKASERQRAARRSRGQADRPRLVVISASLSLPIDLPMFSQPEYRPIIATTTSSPQDRRDTLSEVADVVTLGETAVDPHALVHHLHTLGMTTVLSEGGPRINGQLIQAGLIDEWNLTLAPLLVSGNSRRPAFANDAADPPSNMQLQRIWHSDDDLLFCRWTRRTNH